MAFSFPSLRGIFLLACLGLLALSAGQPAAAQDQPPAQTSAIPPGTTNFQKAPISGILDFYERLSGRHLIRDVNVDGVPPVSVDVTGLSKDDTLKLIEETLLLNGVTLIPVDDKTIKVVTVGTNKNPRSEAPMMYANAADLPKDDQVVNYYMPLDYINPQEAQAIFQSVAPFHTGYGAYTPAPSAQAIILTENVSTIRELIALKELIDAPPARVASEWIQLNRADSDETAALLNKMLGLGPNGTPTAPPGPAGSVIVPADLGNNEPLSNEHNLISGTATILSDPRSNRLLVITRPVNIPFLEQMIGQLDQSSTFQMPQRRPLRYVLANDILPALEAALAEGKDEEDQLKKDVQTAQSGQNGQNGQGQNRPTAQPTTGGGSSGGTGSVSAITPQLSTPTENDVPTVLTIGKTRLMADNRSNSVIVFGSPDVVKRVFDMIDQLDRKPLQVYLATVIGELTVKQGLQFGIDILQNFQHVGQGGLASGLVTPGTTTSSQVPIPNSLTSSLGFPLPTGLTLYGAIGSTLSAYVRALETTDRFKIISRPSVFTENNKLAVIASGSQVPVPSSTTSGFTGATTSNDLTTTSSIAYEDVLLQLDIIPLINASHEVTLQIRQTNNSLGANVNISGNEVPIIDTQEINTTITVPDKSTVVIGGLITDNTSRDTSGVPWLSDIPLLGYLFKNTNKTKERDELIIMIQPSVVETDADQIAVNEEEKARTILGREAAAAATGTDDSMSDTEGGRQPAEIQPALSPQIDTSSVSIRSTSSAYSSKSGSPRNTTTTTTTTIQKIPTTTMTPLGPTTPTGPIPALSSPAPDVSNGRMPKYPPGPNDPSPSVAP
jgi:type II secretion system protein D